MYHIFEEKYTIHKESNVSGAVLSCASLKWSVDRRFTAETIHIWSRKIRGRYHFVAEHGTQNIPRSSADIKGIFCVRIHVSEYMITSLIFSPCCSLGLTLAHNDTYVMRGTSAKWITHCLPNNVLVFISFKDKLQYWVI